MKTVMLEANLKTNKMASTEWTYHKERSFPSNYVSFLIFFFSLETLINSRFDVLTTQISMFTLFVSAEVLFQGVFSLRVSLTICYDFYLL